MSTYFDVFLNFCLTALLLTPLCMYVPIFPPPDSFIYGSSSDEQKLNKQETEYVLLI